MGKRTNTVWDGQGSQQGSMQGTHQRRFAQAEPVDEVGFGEQPLQVTLPYQDIPVVFDRKVLAKLLGISLSAASNVMRKNGFPVVRVSPHRHRIYREAFFRWLESQSRTDNPWE